MVRISKVGRMRNVSYKRPQAPRPKTGPKKDALPHGFKAHSNAVSTEANYVFIPKIK